MQKTPPALTSMVEASRSVLSALTADVRPLAFRWLSGLLADAPEPETLTEFAAPVGQTLLNAVAAEPALSPLAEAVRQIAADPEERHTRAMDLAAAYGRLFLGAAGPASPAPYESFYTSERGTLFQAPAGAMADLLRELDQSVVADMKEPPDHVAIQLSVMAELAERFVQAGTDGAAATALRQRQIEFLDGHLLNWLPSYAEHCANIDADSFYAMALEAAVAFLRRDRAWLAANTPE